MRLARVLIVLILALMILSPIVSCLYAQSQQSDTMGLLQNTDVQKNQTNSSVDWSKVDKAKLATIVAGTSIVVFIFLIVSYVFSSLCVMFIAQKTNTAPAWLAWIPIANLFLMCKIASLSYWWLLILLTAFIPVVGPLANLGFAAYLWYNIALARNKPGWIGILTCLPLAGLVVMGYLAFSE